jgi:hypothetical protein
MNTHETSFLLPRAVVVRVKSIRTKSSGTSGRFPQNNDGIRSERPNDVTEYGDEETRGEEVLAKAAEIYGKDVVG